MACFRLLHDDDDDEKWCHFGPPCGPSDLLPYCVTKAYKTGCLHTAERKFVFV